MRWVITGAGGYIGAHLLNNLLKTGEEVLPLSGKSPASSKRLEFLGIQSKQLDLFDSYQLTRIFLSYKPDVVVHLASLKSPEESNKFPDIYLKHNLEVLKNTFEASCNSGAGILINASSSAVYGNLDSESIRESDSGKPISAYGLSKKLGEDFLSTSATPNMKVCSLRLFNIIGSFHKSLTESAQFHLVPATISRIRSGKRPIVFGSNLPTRDGSALRDYLHVQDVVEIFRRVANLTDLYENEVRPSEHLVVNVGSGQGNSVLEVIKLIQDKLGSNLEPILEPARNGDPVRAVSNIELSRKLFGFSPRFTLEEMIESSFP